MWMVDWLKFQIFQKAPNLKHELCFCAVLFLTKMSFFPVAETTSKSWRPNRSIPVNTSTDSTGGLSEQNNQPVWIDTSEFSDNRDIFCSFCHES